MPFDIGRVAFKSAKAQQVAVIKSTQAAAECYLC
jgi:hypothetical protein